MSRMECYSRDTCEVCSYNEPDSEKDKGIGKQLGHVMKICLHLARVM